MEEQTIVYSIVSKGGEPQSEQNLRRKLLDMDGVSRVDVSTREGRVTVTGRALHPEPLSWALEQSGYDVLFVQE